MSFADAAKALTIPASKMFEGVDTVKDFDGELSYVPTNHHEFFSTQAFAKQLTPWSASSVPLQWEQQVILSNVLH